jgi:hypothetical protein
MPADRARVVGPRGSLQSRTAAWLEQFKSKEGRADPGCAIQALPPTLGRTKQCCDDWLSPPWVPRSEWWTSRRSVDGG